MSTMTTVPHAARAGRQRPAQPHEPVHREVGQRRADPRAARPPGCKQHYQYVSQFPRCPAVVYGGCPDTDARYFLLENIIEEESGTKHVDLLIRFAEACGVSRARGRGRAPAPEARAGSPRGATRPRASPSTWPPPGCSSGWSRRCRGSTSATCRRSRPTTGSPTTRSSSSRSTSRPTRCTASAATRSSSSTPRHAGQAGRGPPTRCAQATEMRWQYMTGLHRAYVLKEDV